MSNQKTTETTTNAEESKTTKKSFSDEVMAVVAKHPFATAAAISLGATYLYLKVNQHMTYKAVYKANVDAYEAILKLQN